MSLTVKYYDIPEGAQKAAQVSSDTGQPFSDPAKVVTGGNDTPWATLEPGVWLLDGSRELLSENPDTGWWSNETSDENGEFATPPVITITFSEPYSAPGLTFAFWTSTEQWCSRLKVTWYNGQTLLAESIFQPDEARWGFEQRVDSFDRIKVEFLATNQPQQFAKIQQIQIGTVVLFGQEEITRVGLVNEVDPTLCSLAVDTMHIEIKDRRGRTFVPQENQKMELYRNGSLLASHYITESSRESGHYYTFSCQSAIGLLNDDFLGGLYSNEPVKNLLGAILNGVGYVLDAAFEGQVITGYLPVCTRREALQQVAFALGAMVTTSGSDSICLLPLPENVSKTFNQKQIFSGAKVESAPRFARYEVAAHSYLPSTETETLLDGEVLQGTDLLLTFDEPHYGYVISGGTLTGSGENWVTITASGAVTLTAKTYTHSSVLHTRRNPSATAAERGNVITVSDATLIHSGNVKGALERLYASGQLRQTLTQDAVISDHKIGDRVASINPWGTQTNGILTVMDSELTQHGHTANVTILGVEVEIEGIHYYAGELRSGDVEVVY